jgi:hypothetical protein
MSALEGTPYLAARVARLAVELDRVAADLCSRPLTVADQLLLEAPATHLRIAVDLILDSLHRADSLDQSKPSHLKVAA